MPLPTADLATTWAFLEEGVDHIMTKPQTVSHAKYMSLHTVAYNYCLSSKMPSNSSEQSAARRHCGPWLTPLAGANLMGSYLYNNLIRYFTQHLRHLRDVSNGLGTTGQCVTPSAEIRLAAE
jgi:cullin 1